MLSSPQEEDAVKQLAQEELKELEERIVKCDEDIEDHVFAENEPERDIIIEIRAAAGGEEAALFVADLFKMYSKYAESKRWKMEVLGSHITEIKGYKEISFYTEISGTSLSAAITSGILALGINYLKKHNLKYKNNDVVKLLFKTCRKIQQSNLFNEVKKYDPKGFFLTKRNAHRHVFGHGLVQAYDFLESLRKKYKINQA